MIGSDDQKVYGISLSPGPGGGTAGGGTGGTGGGASAKTGMGAGTGMELWVVDTGDWVQASAVVGSGDGGTNGGAALAVIGSNDGILRGIEVATGALAWAIDPTTSVCALGVVDDTESTGGSGTEPTMLRPMLGPSGGVVEVGIASASERDAIEPLGSQSEGAARRLGLSAPSASSSSSSSSSLRLGGSPTAAAL